MDILPAAFRSPVSQSSSGSGEVVGSPTVAQQESQAESHGELIEGEILRSASKELLHIVSDVQLIEQQSHKSS